MTVLKISEAGTVQFPMVKHAVEIGWTPLSPAEAEARRQGRANMLFRDELESKLLEFNAWLSDSQARAVVDTLEALPATVEGNRAVLSWMRGERQWYDEAEKRHRPIQVIDFNTPGNNDFDVTWEWKVEPLARKGNRADVMFLINGLPVASSSTRTPRTATRSTGRSSSCADTRSRRRSFSPRRSSSTSPTSSTTGTA